MSLLDCSKYTSTLMHDIRQLVEATGVWLHFEYLCGRNVLFSESYLAYPIGQYLKARFGDHLYPEYVHPVLASLRSGRGDKPRIDFAVIDDTERIKFAVETKWLNTSTSLTEQIIRDLVRLELLVDRYETTAVFVLAGQQRDLENMFTTAKFAPHPEHRNSRPLLSIEPAHVGRTVWLNTRSLYRKELFKRALERFQGIPIYNGINITRTGPFPKDANLDHYVAYGWRINKRDNGRSCPEELFNYKDKASSI